MLHIQELTHRIEGRLLFDKAGYLYFTIGDMQAACDLVARCRKPVVAAIAGRCSLRSGI